MLEIFQYLLLYVPIYKNIFHIIFIHINGFLMPVGYKNGLFSSQNQVDIII